MDYSIRVCKSPEDFSGNNRNLLVKNFTSFEEFQKVEKLCDNKRRITWLEALIIPVRTDNLNNFCKDFFLPGFLNEALKTKGIGRRIFRCIVMPICDIITLPIRLITVIPRYIYNAAHPKESHPFYRYLIEKGVAPEDLSAGYVYLEIERKKESKGPGQCEGADDVSIKKETFNFMHLPQSVSVLIKESRKTQMSWDFRTS